LAQKHYILFKNAICVSASGKHKRQRATARGAPNTHHGQGCDKTARFGR
jgi:hypothetical protein